ncbi:MAG: tape measure protein, partial [Anaerovibrio sp.]|nr:tape measure protein [Anaerovibrio sp.]
GMENASKVGAYGLKTSVKSCNQAMMGFGSTIDVINNKLRNAGNGAFSGLKNALSGLSAGLLGPIALGNVLANGISMLAAKIASIPSKMIEASDEYKSIQGRLRIVAGSAEKAAQMNELIYQSAVRARGSYTDMARSVAEIAMNAKDAFPKPEDAIPFMEGIQKIFAINQTGIEQQKAAMLPLTQALASGRLQGDEFRSIAEAAPMIETMIAKTMGVSRGALKDLAKEGEITAEIIKQAIFENMGEIDEMFLMAPMTWGQRLQVIGTIADHAFNPVKEKLNDLANSDFAKKISLGAVHAADLVARAVMGIMNNIEWGFSVIQNNWGYIEPILMGLAIALLGIAANSAIAAAGEMAMAAASGLNAINSAIMTAEVIAETFAVEGLNAALYACPLTWIIGLIVALVAVFYLAVAAVNYFAGTSISATGLIFGAFAWLFTSIINYVKLVANVFIAFANFLGSVFQNPLGAAYNLFVDIWNAIVDYVAQAVNSIIDMIMKIPGIDKVLGGIGHVAPTRFERKEIVDAAWHINPFEYGNAAYNAEQAYNVGANGFDFSLPELGQQNVPEAGDYSSEPKEGKAAKDTADNTGRMADAMDIQEEDLKYLRDMAEQETINRYTTAEVNIEMGGISNNISSNMDLDGMVTYLNDSLLEAMQAGAEEVHPV